MSERQKSNHPFLSEQEIVHDLLDAFRHCANADDYLGQVVNVIQHALGYYHVQVYLLEESATTPERLVMHSGTGEEGQKRKQHGFSLPINARRSLAAQAVREKRAVIINDIHQSPHHLPHALLPKTQAEAAIPLLNGKRLLGVLDVQHSQLDCFTPASQRILQIAADQISAALVHYAVQQHNAQLHYRLAVLQEIAEAAATAVDDNDLVAQVTRLVGVALRADNVGFRFVDARSGNLRSHVTYQKTVGQKQALTVTGPGEGITGRVLATGQPWRIPDVSQEPAFLGDQAIRSELCVPLFLDGKVMGVINAESVRVNAFSEDDEAFLVTIATQVATAFQKIQLTGTFQRQIEEKDALLTTMKAISSLQIDDVLNTLAREAKRLLEGDASRIHLLEPDGETLSCVVDLSSISDTVRQFPVKIGQGIIGGVALSGTAEIVPNTRFDRRVIYFPGIPPMDFAALLAPLKLRQQVLGVMSVFRRNLNHSFTQADLNLLVAMADQAAVAISNARLFATEQRKRQELSVLNTMAMVAAEADSGDDLLERAKRFIGSRLFPDSFGVMFLDEVTGVLRTHHTYWGPEATVPVENSIAGLVITSGKPYRSADVLQEKRFFEAQFYELGAQMRSKLCVPLKVGGSMIGVLNAENRQPGAFTEADERIMITLARQMEMALEKLQLLEKEQQRAIQQQALAAMSGTVLGALNLPDLWTAVTQATQKIFHADRAAVFLTNSDGDSLICAYAKSLSTTFIESLEAHFNQAPEFQIVHTQNPLLINDALNHPLTMPISDLIKDEGFRSYALFPLITDHDLLGVVGIYYDTPHQFVADDLTTGQTLARIITVALQNVQVFAQRSYALLNEKKFSDFIRQLNEYQDLPTILSNVIIHAANLIEADAGIIALLIEGSILTFYPYNVPPNFTLEPSSRGRGVAWHIVDTGESVLLAEYKQHPQAIDKWVQTNVQAFLGVPLITPEGVQGALCLFNLATQKQFSESDRQLAEAIAEQAGLAIYNSRRFDEAVQRVNQLAISLARQEELARAKDAFVQTLTHELRTPLGIIVGHAELLESGILGNLQPSQTESIHIINRRLQMINEMLDDLSMLLAAQTQEIVHHPIQPQPFINSIVADFQLHTTELSLTLETELPDDLPMISGDDAQLRRVFDNLLSNAMKFTPAGGSVRIHAFPESEYVIICVTDSGVGMPADQLERVFERFYQVRSHKSMNPHGVGLGLALVKEIVEAHGGYVRVESEEGRGSMFEVALPVARWQVSDSAIQPGHLTG